MRSRIRRRRLIESLTVCAAVSAMLLMAAIETAASRKPAQQGPEAVTAFDAPTYSSPIALSADKAFVWSVNPDDDSVSVIDAISDNEIFRIHVGQEPQSVALDPSNNFAYVANAADNSVTVIKITNPVVG